MGSYKVFLEMTQFFFPFLKILDEKGALKCVCVGGVASVIQLLVGRVATKISFSNPSILDSFHQAQCPSCGSDLIHSSIDLRFIYPGSLGFQTLEMQWWVWGLFSAFRVPRWVGAGS